MLRTLHSWSSLVVMVFLIIIAATGAVLSLQPAMDRAQSTIPSAGQVTVATLAQKASSHFSDIEKIERNLSGEVITYYQNPEGQTQAALIDPLTGVELKSYQPSAVMIWVKNLHRSLMMGTTGRGIVGIMSVAMLSICLTGTFLLARRLGGWRALLQPMKGSGQKRIHSELARLAVLGLLLSSLTGTYMSALRFGWVENQYQVNSAFPEQVAGTTPSPVGTLQALNQIDLSHLKELVFPYPDDPQDFYTITTDQGMGYVDQSTGQLLSYQAFPSSGLVQQWIKHLHTGQGLWWLALILGVSALTVPILSYSGVLVWWRRRQPTPSSIKNTDSHLADTVILVGTEGNSTWGFARDLHANLSKAGCHVHCSTMNKLAECYPQAHRLFVLTSTYGNGDAPSTANQFMDKLRFFNTQTELAFAVLGFGDRQFPNFCRFAEEVDQALANKGLQRLQDLERVNACSAAQYTHWGDAISAATNLPFTLQYSPKPISTIQLTLVDREDYASNSDNATSILRFVICPTESDKQNDHNENRVSDPSQNALPNFEAGDLLGVIPLGDNTARFYSLASSKTDGIVEICVRKKPGGVCSGYLHNLVIGDRIDCFIRYNPEFRPHTQNTRAPVILIGAGTGIGPLTGFIRNNEQRHPMYLYWGGRSAQKDFLYQPDLKRYLDDQRLTKLSAAFSQSDSRIYVQEKLRRDQQAVRQMIELGAQILVCGSRSMANGVNEALDDILAPMQLKVATLKAQGRYLEDVY